MRARVAKPPRGLALNLTRSHREAAPHFSATQEWKNLVSRPLRLLGLGVSNLREPTAQQLIFL